MKGGWAKPGWTQGAVGARALLAPRATCLQIASRLPSPPEDARGLSSLGIRLVGAFEQAHAQLRHAAASAAARQSLMR